MNTGQTTGRNTGRKSAPKRSTAKKSAYQANQKRGAANLKTDVIKRTLLGREVVRRIEQLQMNNEQAAKAIDDAASQVSRLRNGHFADFSQDRLVKMLIRLGSSVDIKITHPKRNTGARKGKVTLKSA